MGEGDYGTGATLPDHIPACRSEFSVRNDILFNGSQFCKKLIATIISVLVRHLHIVCGAKSEPNVSPPPPYFLLGVFHKIPSF